VCGFLLHFADHLNIRTSSLLHRGPDQQYFQRESGWQIEYFRLAITGVVDGKSPSCSVGNRYAVYLNGEIYNFRELQSLYALPFSNSDSVTIANLVEMHGVEALKDIRGMYAFVLHDTRENILYVARDPLGEKPLFVFNDDGQIIFGSEFRSVLDRVGGKLQLDQNAVSDYLRFNYVEEPNTFDLRIKAFPKGQLLKIYPGSQQNKFLFSLEGFSEKDIEIPLENLIYKVLDEATTTEVASALSLSSGLDSTTILVRKMLQSNSQFSAITLNTSYESRVSEVAEVREHAEAVGAHLDIVSTANSPSTILLKRLILAMDQPICDPSALNYFLIFEQARNLSKKVVFLGQGPDEFFWGYPHYYKLLAESTVSSLELNASNFLNVPQRSSRLLACLSPRESGNVRTLNSSDPFLKSNNMWQIFRANMVHGYLSHNGFAQIDRLSMHFSVEARSPLADSRIYGWAQHNSLKDSRSFDKAEFKNSISLGSLEHVKQKPKVGFRSDITSILENRQCAPLLDEAYWEVFENNLIDWRFKYPKFILTKNEKWKVLVLGLWLNSLSS
jgi:asparagine synthase (glutamine-hydrolysing)